MCRHARSVHGNQWNEATEVKDTEEKWKVFISKLMYAQRAVSYLVINMFRVGGKKQMYDLCSGKSKEETHARCGIADSEEGRDD